MCCRKIKSNLQNIYNWFSKKISLPDMQKLTDRYLVIGTRDMEEWKLQYATRSSSAVFWANIDKTAWSYMLSLSQWLCAVCYHYLIGAVWTGILVAFVFWLLSVHSRVQKFLVWHTKAMPNGKCCEGYIVPSVVKLMYQFQAAACSSILEALVLVGRVALSYCNVKNWVPRSNQIPQ